MNQREETLTTTIPLMCVSEKEEVEKTRRDIHGKRPREISQTFQGKESVFAGTETLKRKKKPTNDGGVSIISRFEVLSVNSNQNYISFD